MTADQPRTGRLCPRGHKMEEIWEVCLYCQSEERARERSGGRPAGATAMGEMPQGGDSRKTMVMQQPSTSGKATSSTASRGESASQPSAGATRISPAQPDSYGPYGGAKGGGEEVPPQRPMSMSPAGQPTTGSRPGPRDSRRIVALLVTYTWHPEGDVFPIREGKNFIGRTQVSSEVQHRDCDIQIPQDEWMTGEHALILCRAGNYELMDLISANGTFLDGRMLKSNQSEELRNYAQVKTGSTLWTFIMIAPQGGRKEPQPSGEEPDTAPEDTGITVR